MTKTLLATTIVLFVAMNTHAAEFEIKDTAGQYADIVRDGKTLVRYMYARDESTDETKHNTYKVYHHVFDPSGKTPITKGPGGKYTHHRGLFIGFSKLTSHGKTTDLWHMKNTLQTHIEFVKQESSAEGATLSSVIHWTIPSGISVKETRTVIVHNNTDSHLLIDFQSELTAVGSDAQFNGDPEHAGMQYRPHNGVAENKSAKYLFPAEKITAGNVKDEIDLPWAALSYQLGDDTYSVQHINHPENPRGTKYSAYRDYGRFGAFPVFEVAQDKSRTLRYRIRVTEGDLPSRDQLAAEYDKFVK